MHTLNLEKDILKLLHRDIPYSLRVRLSYGEFACREIVRSVDDAKTWNYKSLNDIVKDEKYFHFAKKILQSRNEEVTEESLTKVFRRYGVYPTNFKPSLAKAIYSKFCNVGDTCLDYSSGFGGRLLGCLCTGKSLNYIGFEPNTKASSELKELGSKALEVVKEGSFKIINDVSENICQYIEDSSIDMAFSCPPYYKYEVYCLEETQSIFKYPKYEDWLSGYVFETISSIYKVLKPGGLFLVYIMNVTIDGVYYPLIEDWVHISEKVGFSLEGCEVVNKNFSIAGRSCLVIFKK